MERVKDFLRERSLGFYLAIPAIIIAFITIFLYKKIGITVFSPTLNKETILFLILGIIFTVISLGMTFIPFKYVKMFAKLVRFIAYLMYLYAFLMFVYSQVNFIANVFVAIDGNSFSATFILTMVFYILACLLTGLSAGLDNCIPWNKNNLVLDGEEYEEK